MTCTVLIGTRQNYRECGLAGDPCSGPGGHALFNGPLPRSVDELPVLLNNRDVARPSARPVVPVRGEPSRASSDDPGYGVYAPC